MRERILTFTRRSFVRNVTVLTSATVATQAITMAFSPLITRLYSPEAFGIQGVFVSIMAIMGTIASMSYPIAIILPKSDSDALGLAHLSIYLGIVTSILVTIILFFFGFDILALLNAENISYLMYLIPLAMFISVVGDTVSQWLIRKKAFFLSARVSVWSALLINPIKTGLGLIHPTATVLIITNMLGGLLTTALLMLGLRKSRINNQTERHISSPKLSTWALAKRYSDFPFLRTPQGLLNAVSQSLPVMMLATYFSPANVGFYSIASTVLVLPTVLIGSAVMQVFYPRINEAIQRREDAKALIIKGTIGLGISGILPFAAVIIAGPSLFEFIFGSGWSTAGVYAQWLAPWLFFQYINKPAVSAIPSLQLQGGLLIYELFSTASKFLALYLGYAVFESDIAAIALFSTFGVLAYVWLILWVIFHSGKLASTDQSNLK